MGEDINENTIWNCRQNNPELVVRDCVVAFGLDEEQAERLRFILIMRGVNKWLYARRMFIKLKHKIKEMLNEERKKGRVGMNEERFRVLQFINIEMQKIAKMPRWIEFPPSVTHNWKNIEKKIIVKGKHC